MAETTHEFSFVAADEAATLRCAAWLAALAQPGWLVVLEGDLGAGKTAFARGFIQAKCGHKTDVPSPSFTLVQPYETAVPPIYHADFYRLSAAQEIDELGIVDALDTHCCLVEWAERAEGLLPLADVRVTLSHMADDDMARHIAIEATPDMLAALAAKAARDAALVDFLNQADWSDAHRAPLAGDASTRRYERLHHETGSAILMDWAKGPDGPPIYDGKPYSQMVHLAEAMPAYCRMVDWLAAHDLAVPRIMARDEGAGFALMDDFGDAHLANDKNLDRPVFYREAVANLLHLQAAPAADFLAAYDGAVQAVEASLFTDWFLPDRHIQVSKKAAAEWQARWRVLGDELMTIAAPVTVLRDYHSVNLLWRAGAQARYRIGLIDVQDALAGHAAYDLASLLCDARIDVDADLAGRMKRQYMDARFGQDQAARDDFEAAFAVCAVQRNAKIAGIFVRLAKRDSKPDYLRHVPRVLGYMRAHLTHPALAPIADWLDTHAAQVLEVRDD